LLYGQEKYKDFGKDITSALFVVHPLKEVFISHSLSLKNIFFEILDIAKIEYATKREERGINYRTKFIVTINRNLKS